MSEQELIAKIDRMISTMDLHRARRALLKVDVASVSLERRAEFAHLCRRAGINRLGLKFLHALIRETDSATANDHIEYAACLRRLGLTHQALRALRGVGDQPQALLHQAYCFVQEWNYHASCALLLKFLELEPAPREALVAKVNLITGLIFLNEWDTAEQWLDEVEPLCRIESNHLLLNCQELRVQILHHRGRLDEARRCLEQAGKLAAGERGVTPLLLEKWGHIVNFDGSEASRARLREFQEKVRREGHWETLRHLDWEMASAFEDGDLAKQVYFGTPYPAFRHMILASPLARLIPPQTLRSDARSLKNALVVDGLTGENMPFKFGSLPYRTLMLMGSDAYQPWTVFRIFDGMFPDEDFDPFSSANRVYQLLDRMRSEIAEAELPIEIQSSGRGFRLRPLGTGAIVLHDRMIYHSVEELVLHSIKRKFGEREFTVRDLKGVTPLSATQKSRALRALVEGDELEITSGKSKVHKYRVRAA